MQNAPKTGEYPGFNANLRIFYQFMFNLGQNMVKTVTFLQNFQETQTKISKTETIFQETEKIFPETETKKSKN